MDQTTSLRDRGMPERIGHFSLLVQDLGSGGAERVLVTLANALSAKGHQVDLLVCSNKGPLRQQVASAVKIIELNSSPLWIARLATLAANPSLFTALLRPVLLPIKPSLTLPHYLHLAAYLRKVQPEILISALPPLNVESILARRLAKSSTRIAITEHGMPEDFLARKKWRNRYFRDLMRATYPSADVIISVSEGIKQSLAMELCLPSDRIMTIYNPAVPDDVTAKANAPVDHPWLTPGQPPVVLAVGRLSREKDFPTLLRAFAKVRETRRVRLLVLGEAQKPKDRAELAELASHLGIQEDTQFIGFVENPFSYMSRSALLVVSSLHEGFGNVIVEAMACGCPVVSTDCPSGPSEILENGRYGRLVPVGDHLALANGVIATLDAPPPSQLLRDRASVFSSRRSVKRYESLICDN